MRLMALVDMDYFFATCEELRRPEIRKIGVRASNLRRYKGQKKIIDY